MKKQFSFSLLFREKSHACARDETHELLLILSLSSGYEEKERRRALLLMLMLLSDFGRVKSGGLSFCFLTSIFHLRLTLAFSIFVARLPRGVRSPNVWRGHGRCA